MGQAASSAKRDKPPKAFHESDSGGSSEDSGSRARAGNGLERDPESVPDGSTQSQAPHIDTDGHQKTGGEPDHRGNSWKCVSKECTIALSVALAATFSASIASIIALLAAPVTVSFSVQRAKPALADGCPPAGPLCPDGWVGYRGKCYSFSEGEGSWTDSRSNCSALSASLAGIDTLQELAFMLRYKGKPDHWIGLRKDSGQLWKWANGTEFNHLFRIRGGGDCAYLNDENGVSSLRCTSERRWICSKLDAFTAAKQAAMEGANHRSVMEISPGKT
ncbi:C-type lectin domain family 2 member E-like isoform X1 [Pelodiscus sinensis]|uniref:C-type lectin domain family 2 member E-like isoform X1 n=1 Tax=Pelodiscus sinensis TaxID=13735 RepID=UPI003F6D0689